ncbi:hypothetical protein WN944_016985 [Citrus x changshan-huyou]|uniref:CASP-like protein n=1 Tax=Citrus x changshan-huyou TaxID=2935761 RepID=A0AAP0MD09_9ROSI
MGSQYKPSNMDGVATVSNVKVVESSKRVMFKSSDVMLRILGFSLTFIAAIVVGVDKETKIISFTLAETMPSVQVSVTAKWQFMSAFVYFLVSNAIASSYAALSLAFTLAITRFHNNAALGLIMLDLITMGLLFSANGAAMAIGMIGLKGNSHVHWNKVCNVFGGFCRNFTAALVLSMLGSFAFLFLVAVAILNLHKRSQ